MFIEVEDSVNMDLSFLTANPLATNDPFSQSQQQISITQNHLQKEKIHVRLQDQKNRKLTIIEGLDDDLDQHRIAKAMKRVFNCASSIQSDKDGRDLILLQGDQRLNVREWLLAQEILTQKEADERLVLHGF